MELSRLLNQGSKVKIEVSVDDLKDFAEYLLDKYTNENKELGIQEPEFGGIDLAIEITGYSKSTIYNKVSKKELPVHRNGKLYFSRNELVEWMKSNNAGYNKKNDITKYMK
jgi:excisionase family DNA binding protein